MSLLHELVDFGAFTESVKQVCVAIVLFYCLRYVFQFLQIVLDTIALKVTGSYKLVDQFGKWGIVTGATDGIGKAMAMELARKGMHLILISRTATKLEALEQEMKTQFPNLEVKTIAIDFSRLTADDKEKVKQAIQDVGDIGVLINNVGVSYAFPMFFDELSEEEVRNLMEINIASTTWMTYLVLPKMVENKRGAIVNLSSGSARLCVPLLSEYAAAKTYIEQFTLCLAAEYASKGISIQCHTPMFVTTKLAKIRRASFFIPSPETYAKHAVANIGYDTISSPYWPHALQIAIFENLPPFIVAKFSLQKHLGLRKRGMAKRGTKQD